MSSVSFLLTTKNVPPIIIIKIYVYKYYFIDTYGKYIYIFLLELNYKMSDIQLSFVIMVSWCPLHSQKTIEMPTKCYLFQTRSRKELKGNRDFLYDY